MKNWLSQKQKEQKNLFQELIDLSIGTLKTFNIQENKNTIVRVIFSKNNWLDGYSTLEFLEKNNEGKYNVKNQYRHCIYNKNKDLQDNIVLTKLMSKGIFTNAWFSILNSSRSYDITFVLTDNNFILENGEYREKKMRETHTGFNIVSPEEKKKKSKKIEKSNEWGRKYLGHKAQNKDIAKFLSQCVKADSEIIENPQQCAIFNATYIDRVERIESHFNPIAFGEDPKSWERLSIIDCSQKQDEPLDFILYYAGKEGKPISIESQTDFIHVFYMPEFGNDYCISVFETKDSQLYLGYFGVNLTKNF